MVYNIILVVLLKGLELKIQNFGFPVLTYRMVNMGIFYALSKFESHILIEAGYI